MNNQNQKGFTLVELSIVLVIIGLLIGGILAAQSMITTTKIQAFARQIGQFDAAVVNFQDKYRALPGDSSVAIGGDAGNGNGIIEADATGTATSWEYEVANFWVMLQTSGFKSEDGALYVNTAPTNGIDKTHGPQAKAGNKASFYVIGWPDPTGFGAGSANGYVASSCLSGGVNPTCTDGFSGPDAIAIDTKLDNGKGDSGNVIGNPNAPSDLTETVATPGSVYVATDSTPNTNLAIRVGNAAGNPM